MAFHLDKYVEQLKEKNLSLIILKNGEAVFASGEEGMRPLFKAIRSVDPVVLRGSVVVDKIVGKAAALLISYFEAQEVHCAVMSVRAKEVLKRNRIRYCAEETISEIANRFGTGICPFEAAVLDVEKPEEGYRQLSAKLKL